ncbi:MAG: RNA-binding S4 domain-containing protein [Clostridia bacterium]|nr:RNA-binding S4 domain-containing protein [Clostridia bacterium]
MRLDKYLKVSRIIKRRTVANDVADMGRVSVNGRTVKPSYDVKVGDIIEIQFGSSLNRYEVLSISEHTTKAGAADLYRILPGAKNE